MIDEFIDAYSDDQIYLEMIEKLVNDHPQESLVPDSIKYSSFCRLWVVMMVGSIEMMIKKWAKPEEMMADIAAYLNKSPNTEKIDGLFRALELRGLRPIKDHFDDYLACKYIRNAYVHGEWDDKQREYVESRNFPATTMQFLPEHYARIKECYYHVLNKVGMANALNTVIKQKLGA